MKNLLLYVCPEFGEQTYKHRRWPASAGLGVDLWGRQSLEETHTLEWEPVLAKIPRQRASVLRCQQRPFLKVGSETEPVDLISLTLKCCSKIQQLGKWSSLPSRRKDRNWWQQLLGQQPSVLQCSQNSGVNYPRSTTKSRRKGVIPGIIVLEHHMPVDFLRKGPVSCSTKLRPL